MQTKTNTLLCLSAVFGLPFLIAGCADAIVEEAPTTSEATEPVEENTTGIERLTVEPDGTIGHAAIDFEEAIASKDGIVLVDFWATWCGPCVSLAPELEKLAADYPDQITIVKVDVDIATELARSYEVSSIPDMRVFKAGEQIDKMVGGRDAAAIASQIGL